MTFEDILSPGKENARTTEELIKYFNFKSSRELTQLINRERKNGSVILSTTTGVGGYYLPANIDEIKDFIKNMEHRAAEIKAATESAKKALERYTE